MQPTTTELQNRILELENRVQSLDRQIRGRNSTLACVLASCGGSIRVSGSVMKEVREQYAGATFQTQHDSEADEYIISAQMMPKPVASA